MNEPAPQPFDPETLKALAGLQFRARYVVEGFLSGMHESPFHGYSIEFSDYRNYQPGDDLRHLDWRYYARADKLCIKRYEQETNLQFHVIADSSRSMGYRGGRAWCSKLDYAKIVAASLCWLLLKQKDATGLMIQEADAKAPRAGEAGRARRGPQLHYLKPSQKPSQFGHILGQIEAVEPAGGSCLATLLDHAPRLIRRRSVILLVSDLLDPAEEVQAQLKQLHFLGHEVLVFQVLDRDELDFPFDKDRIFEDMESGERRRVRPQQVRQTYLERFEAFQENYRRLFRALEIHHLVLPTDADPGRALAFFLAQRQAFA
jgi:uncharacterized protein (DUF58 family)